MYVNSAQKFLTYMGYYTNGCARASARSIERLTRPMPQGNGYWTEGAQRVKHALSSLFSIPLAAVLFLPAFSSYVLAACVGSGRFELIEPKSTVDFWKEKFIKIMSLNACLQDPWSPLTGGVVPPFEPVGDCPSRIAAVVNEIAKEAPALFLGQEFENLGAQDKFIQLMKAKGYHYFLRDLGSNEPVRNSSGLFVASKVPLNNIKFIPYPAKDRAGLAKWSGQGALTFTISIQGQDLRLVNVHLNYGEGKENQEARNRQLTHHVAPLLVNGRSMLFGDLNFNTATIGLDNLGLIGFRNSLEGNVTCTDYGKHTLRGKSYNPGGKPCTDCAEKIDGLIYNAKWIQSLESCAKQLALNNQLLSDHSAIVATIQPAE